MGLNYFVANLDVITINTVFVGFTKFFSCTTVDLGLDETFYSCQTNTDVLDILKDYTVSIDGVYSGSNDVVHRINTMDMKLEDYNNGDLGIGIIWYDVLDISSVQIQHQFI